MFRNDWIKTLEKATLTFPYTIQIEIATIYI